MTRTVTVVLTGCAALLLFATPAVSVVDSFFDVFTDIPFTGVAPTPFFSEDVKHMLAGPVDLTHHTMLKQMSAAQGPPLPVKVVMQDPLPPGQPSLQSFFDIFYDITFPDPYPIDSFFDVFYKVELPGAGTSHLVPLNPNNPNGFFDVFVGDSFFDITYRVEVGPGGGCHELHVHGAAGGGLGVGNVHIAPPPNAESFFDIFVDLKVMSPPDLNQPLMRLTNTGQYLSPPVGTEPTTWGQVKSLYRPE